MIFVVIVLLILLFFIAFGVFWMGPDMIEDFHDQLEEWKNVLGVDKDETDRR